MPPAGLHFSTLEGLVINTAFAPKNIVNVNPIVNSFPTRSQHKMQNKFPVETLCKCEHTGSNIHHCIALDIHKVAAIPLDNKFECSKNPIKQINSTNQSASKN